MYFIQSGEHGPVKIGLSNKPQRRIGQLQTGNPDELRLRHVIPGTPAARAPAAPAVEPARIRGEWFGREYLPIILAFGGGLAGRMVRAYDGTGVAPIVSGTTVVGTLALRAVRQRVLEAIVQSRLARDELLEFLGMSPDELDGHVHALMAEELAPGELRRIRDRLDPWDHVRISSRIPTRARKPGRRSRCACREASSFELSEEPTQPQGPSADAFQEARRALADSEIALARSYGPYAGRELGIADTACVMHLVVLLSVPRESGSLEADDAGKIVSGDIRLVQLTAQIYIGNRALRTIRAARSVLSHGYEPEARALDRILVELLAHRRAIIEDESGTEALAWLEGRRSRGISGRVRVMSPTDLYKHLSEDSHGDPAPISRLFSSDSEAIPVAPRRGIATRASLLMYAGFARDQAVVVAKLARFELKGLEVLDAEIQAGLAALDAHDDPQPRGGDRSGALSDL